MSKAQLQHKPIGELPSRSTEIGTISDAPGGDFGSTVPTKLTKSKAPRGRLRGAIFRSNSAMFDEPASLQFGHCLAQLLLRVHYDRPVPGHRLFDRLPRHQQKTNPLVAGLNHDLVTAVEQHQRVIADIVTGLRVGIRGFFGSHPTRLRGIPDSARTGKHISKRVASSLDFDPLLLSRGDRDVKVIRISSHAFDWPSLAPKLAADDAHARAIIVGDLGDRARRNILIARVGHL